MTRFDTPPSRSLLRETLLDISDRALRAIEAHDRNLLIARTTELEIMLSLTEKALYDFPEDSP